MRHPAARRVAGFAAMRVAAVVAVAVLLLPVAAAQADCSPEECRQVKPMADVEHVVGPFAVDMVWARTAIVESVAATHLRLTVSNPGKADGQGMLRVPMPSDGALQGFAVEGKWGRAEAQVVPVGLTAAGQPQVEGVTLLRADDVLLELAVRLASGESVVLDVRYSEFVPLVGGARVYRLPLDPGQLKAKAVDVELTAASRHGVEGMSFPGLEMRYGGDGTIGYTYQGTDVAQLEELVAVWREGPGDWLASAICTGPAGAGYVEGMFLAQSRQSASLETDRVFVVDRSGSMDGTKIVEAREAVREGLLGLRPTDRYAVLVFDHAVEAFESDLVPADELGIAEDRELLARLQARGSTDIDAALQEALGLLGRNIDGRVPGIVLVTDGYPSSGVTDRKQIQERFVLGNTRGAVLDVLAIGMDAQGSFLSSMAAATGGELIDFDSEDFSASIAAFLDRIREPIVVDLTAGTTGFAHSGPVGGRQPPMYRDTTLTVVFGDTWPAGATTALELEGRDADGAVDERFAFTPEECQVVPAAAPLVAKVRLEALDAQQRLEGKEDKAALSSFALQKGLASAAAGTAWALPGSTPIPPKQAVVLADDELGGGGPAKGAASPGAVALAVALALAAASRAIGRGGRLGKA